MSDREHATLVAFLWLVASACRAEEPFGIDASVLASASPGVGGGFSLAQELAQLEAGRLDFELGAERQGLDEAGPAGDEWKRVWGGARLGPEPGSSGPDGSLGVTWLRSTGVSDALDRPGDYGGAYLALGWLFDLGGGFATGPELTGMYVDAEGQRGGSAGLFEFAWRLVLRW